MRQSKASQGISFRGLLCQKTGIIFRIEEFRTTQSIEQSFKYQGFGHKAPNCAKTPKCVVCDEAHSPKTVQARKKEVQIVGDLMSPAI